MKIDEKVVCYYESCNSPVDKEGYLSKKGEIKTSYQKRWFVLKGNLLFYKDRPTDRDLIGVIVLEGCTVQLCESEEKFAFSLVWSDPGLRTYKFSAEDQVSQESWIKALTSASHCYLALLVMDMERKYGDALGAFPGEPHGTFTVPNFTTAEANHSAAILNPHASTLSSNLGQAAGARPSLSSSQRLHAQTISWSGSASKRSPKLWPKRSINAVAGSTPLPPMLEWSGSCLGPQDDFRKLHEDFGKEVKELITDWSKRGHIGEIVQEENLIDFG